MTDAIVVGCGFAGAVAARELAQRGKAVLVLEKRAHIAGNMFESTDVNGIRCHCYGPHIFHTNSKPVFDYLQQFSRFYRYEHCVLGSIDGGLVPIPFNFTSLESLRGRAHATVLERKLVRNFPGRTRVAVSELRGSAEPEIRALGEFVFEKVFLHYTAKQWGVPPERVDPSVTARVPVVLGYDNRYFADEYQYMPEEGFTALFEKLLDHPLITVGLGCDALTRLTADTEHGRLLFDGEQWDKPVVFTGAVDELLGCRFGALPYRSLRLEFVPCAQTVFQPAAVVNYPNEEAFTRITEFKYLTRQRLDGATTILREYPLPYDPSAKEGSVPFYPVAGQESRALYERYRQ
ncbi:MAG: UDP-galactopyranose mutase, partial [Clostridia bacterium]|nr:UDP-galactopyranose mutase [Clostridia bacterium]